MLPRIDAGVAPPGRVTGAPAALPVGDARQEQFQRAMSALVGKTMTATVVARTPDGGALVQVGGTAVRMALPANLPPGAEVPLTLVSVSPRPTFQIGNSGQLTAGYAPAGPAPGTPNIPGSPPPAQAAPGQAAATLPSAALTAQQQAAALVSQQQSASFLTTATPRAPIPGAANPAGNPAAPATPGLPGGLPDLAADAATVTVPQRSLGATLLARAPLTPAEQLPALDRNTPAPTLSAAARAIASALGASTVPLAPVILFGKTALIAAGVKVDTPALAGELKQLLGKSGLFYESHVAEWAEGKRPLADLMREPQMQRMLAAQAQSGAEALAKTAAGPDLSAAQMVNQQLHTHEQQRLQWQGQAWPGQPMEWDVRRESRQGQPGQEQQDGEPETLWRSGVRFRFPLLGKVAATVTVVGEQVHIQVQADSGDTAATLRAWSDRLQLAMEAAGAPLTSLTIGEEAGDGDSHGA